MVYIDQYKAELNRPVGIGPWFFKLRLHNINCKFGLDMAYESSSCPPYTVKHSSRQYSEIDEDLLVEDLDVTCIEIMDDDDDKIEEPASDVGSMGIEFVLSTSKSIDDIKFAGPINPCNRNGVVKCLFCDESVTHAQLQKHLYNCTHFIHSPSLLLNQI